MEVIRTLKAVSSPILCLDELVFLLLARKDGTRESSEISNYSSLEH